MQAKAEHVANMFLQHLENKGAALKIEQNKWMITSSDGPKKISRDELEHILRTYLSEQQLPQTTMGVTNILKIMRAMLDPHPLGKNT
jgi:hypothetical protein